MAPIRTLLYTDGMVAGYYREVLPAHYPGVLVATELPAVSKRTYPLVVVVAVPTGSPRSPAASSPRNAGLVGRVVLDVQCWTTDSKRGCADLGETLRNLTYRLWNAQLVRPEGHVTGYELQSGPAPIPSDDSTAPWRVQALFRLRVRPPRA